MNTLHNQLKISSISHSYGKLEAVRDVSLTIDPGIVHCLLGPSGSGKSTLLRVIAGLEQPVSGTVTIAGIDVNGPHLLEKPENRSVGFVFQDYALFPHLNVLRNVLYGMPGAKRSEQRKHAAQLLERVEMAGYESAMPHTLSGGQQQRVALARALARKPAVMLLDEPFSSLDARLRTEVRDTTLRVLREMNVATLLVTHDPREAMGSGDWISVIREGKLIQTAIPEDLYFRPVDQETAETFGTINRLPATQHKRDLLTPSGSINPDTLPCDSDGFLLIRPELLELHSPGNPVSSIWTSGVVVRVDQEGGTNLVTVQVKDKSRLYARCLAPTSWKPGNPVQIKINL